MDWTANLTERLDHLRPGKYCRSGQDHRTAGQSPHCSICRALWKRGHEEGNAGDAHGQPQHTDRQIEAGHISSNDAASIKVAVVVKICIAPLADSAMMNVSLTSAYFFIRRSPKKTPDAIASMSLGACRPRDVSKPFEVFIGSQAALNLIGNGKATAATSRDLSSI